MDQVKTVFKATFALLGVMVLVTVIVDRFMDNPAQVPGDKRA